MTSREPVEVKVRSLYSLHHNRLDLERPWDPYSTSSTLMRYAAGRSLPLSVRACTVSGHSPTPRLSKLGHPSASAGLHGAADTTTVGPAQDQRHGTERSSFRRTTGHWLDTVMTFSREPLVMARAPWTGTGQHASSSQGHGRSGAARTGDALLCRLDTASPLTTPLEPTEQRPRRHEPR